MVKLSLVTTKKQEQKPIASHRAAATEGEAAQQLLEVNGYPLKKASSNQFELACPFHEEPGPVPPRKSANFYINKESGLYFCLAGETLVQTRDGAVPIRDLAGTSPEILTTQLTSVDSVVRRDGRWVMAPIRSFGQQALMRVTIERLGQRREIYATPEHRWMVRDQSKSGFVERVTGELGTGDRLISLSPTTKVATAVPSSIGIAHGATYGDGTIATNGSGRIALHGEKRELLRYFPEPQTWDSVNENGHPIVTVGGLPKAWKQLPSLDESVVYLYGWLAGYLATDGTVSKTGVVALESYDAEALAHVETICLKLGIHTYGVRSYKHEGIAGVTSMMHRLTFASASLPDALFVRAKHRTRRLNARPDAAYRTWVVANVEATDRIEEVFCATVEETGVFALAEGLLTGNCHSASCGEKGNLQTLERFFGYDSDEPSMFQGREEKLKYYESLLTPERRQVLYDEGLTDTTIERFRVGWVDEHRTTDGRSSARSCYVFPYLETRRPVAFRFYDPECKGPNGSKYWWEEGTNARPYNVGDAVGDEEGRVFLCEGEKKTMLLAQLGYAAVGLPGAANFKREWHEHFAHAKRVIIAFDNDNPEYHVYKNCHKCGADGCRGHNPGQEAAIKMVETFGWRASNVVLPLPEGQRKVDINEYFVRDGHTAPDFAELALGVRKAPYIVSSLADIEESPPDEAAFIVDHGILPRGGRLLISGQPKTGKANGVRTPVLTPTGWSTMGTLRPGDRVVGADGKPTEVIAIHPQGRKAIYRVTTSDGSSTECTLEHLWNIQSHNDHEAEKKDGRPRWKTVTTAEVERMLAEGKERHTYLPMVEPIEYDPVGPLPIDPYALGLLLGDGSMVGGTPMFAKPDLELHDALAKAFPELAFSQIQDARSGNTYISDPSQPGNRLKAWLGNLGLWGSRSWEKFVPETYLRAPVADRLALLQGLLDTDGWVQVNQHGNSGAWFATTSEQLKDHVVELAESLGGTTSVSHKAAPKHQGGEGRPAWQVGIRLPEELVPFRLTHKLTAWRDGRTSKHRPPVRRITSVEYVEHDDAVCITVANADGLYVTERFIVTHNSILAEHLALSVASGIPFLQRFPIDEPRRVLLLDRELSERALYDRLQEFIRFRPGYRAARENLLIDHHHQLRLDLKDSYDPISQLVEQNGADVVILDTAYKFFEGDMESSSAIRKMFSNLDKLIESTGVSIVVTHHQRKKVSGQRRKDTDVGDPDNVAGSFLWTGWPNATILLDFMDRRLNSPFNVVCSFAAFRDAAPPDPLGLYRDSDSINYSAIQEYVHEEGPPKPMDAPRLTPEAVGDLLINVVPMVEDDFLHLAATKFACRADTVRPYLIDLVDQGYFTRSNGRPPVLKYARDVQEETYEEEHGLPPTDTQLRLVTQVEA